jgi:hypothetical protein
MRNHAKIARERAARILKFRESKWDGDTSPNSKLKLAIALGLHPDRLAKLMKLPGAPKWQSGRGVGGTLGGYDLTEFKQFIASKSL